MPSAVLRKKGVSKEKFDRCLDDVRKESGHKVNEFAVCEASMQEKRGIRKRRKPRREMRSRR